MLQCHACGVAVAERGMKIAACYTIYNEEEYLAYSIHSIYDDVDIIP